MKALKILSAVTLAAAADLAAAQCEFEIEVGDALSYSTSEMVVGAGCEIVSVTIKHTGKLTAAAMGHNWVLSKADDFQTITAAAAGAGMANDYVPESDAVIAHTALVGGGQSDTISFSTEGLSGDGFVFFCSFPGHWSVMKGELRFEEA
jgi:azurin